MTSTYNVPLYSSETGARAASFTWEFLSANGSAPRSGTYACGSLWVAPAVGDTGVQLVSLSATSGGVAQPSHISVCADPSTARRGLLNNANNYGNYNAGDNLMSALPATITPVDAVSLVAALQRNETESPGGGTPAITGERTEAYCFVTIVAQPPADSGANSIRPNITGASKEFLTWNDFDLTKLGSTSIYSALSGTELTAIQTRWRHSTEIFGYNAYVGGLWKGYSEGGRAFRADVIHDEYGAGFCAALQDDILALFNNGNTLADKKPALASILAFANDLYHARYNSARGEVIAFTSGAGQHAGKYAPLLLLAALSTDSTKTGNIKDLSVENHDLANAQKRGPQEIRQIKRGVTGVVLWGDGFPWDWSSLTAMTNGNELRRYWGELLGSQQYRGQDPKGNPATGEKTKSDPHGYIDGPPNYPGYAYMGIGAAGTSGIAALMVLMPAIRSIVNTDAPIEFTDRVLRLGTWATPDPAAPPPNGWSENTWNPGVWPGTGFGVTFGPNPSDIRFPITDGTNLGRFAAADWHAKQVISLGYQPLRARSPYWDSIMALYTGERYEDNLVSLTETAKPDIIVNRSTVYITHPHPLATIYYTTDGSTPTEASAVYSAPFSLGGSSTIKAFAATSGKTSSLVRTYTSSTAPRRSMKRVGKYMKLKTFSFGKNQNS